MLGGLADGIARAAGRLRRGRHRPAGSPVRVNVGSGLHVAPGWIHVDGNIHTLMAGSPRFVLRLLHRAANTVQWLPADEYVDRLKGHAFVHFELERGLPFDDGTVDFLYSSHVLEHFFRADGERLVAEIHRVLRPGGIARLCVPDLEHAVRLYRDGAREEFLSYFFTPSEHGYYRRHRYMYDFTLLRDVLEGAGFRSIERRAYREGRVPDLDRLDNRPEETLYVEAEKGAGPRG